MQRTLLYASLFTFAAWTAEAAEVRVKAEATCSGAVIRLKDVADVIAVNENEAAALAEMTLFPVPSAGKTRIVRRGEIRELLALSGGNMQAVTLSGAEKLAVGRTVNQSSPKSQPPGDAVAQATIPTAFIPPTTKVPTRVSEAASLDLVPVVTRPIERGAILRAADLDFRPSAQQA